MNLRTDDEETSEQSPTRGATAATPLIYSAVRDCVGGRGGNQHGGIHACWPIGTRSADTGCGRAAAGAALACAVAGPAGQREIRSSPAGRPAATAVPW